MKQEDHIAQAVLCLLWYGIGDEEETRIEEDWFKEHYQADLPQSVQACMQDKISDGKHDEAIVYYVTHVIGDMTWNELAPHVELLIDDMMMGDDNIEVAREYYEAVSRGWRAIFDQKEVA